MSPDARRFVRDNVFLVAAVLLPLLVVGFFLLAAIYPQWTVPGPAFDAVLRVGGPYEQPPMKVTVDYRVRNNQIEAVVRPLPENGYSQPYRLVLFDHSTLNVRELQIDIPDRMEPEESPRTIPVPELASRQVLDQVRAPDGYELRNDTQHGPGLFGDLFGMHRYDTTAAFTNRGRVVPIALPTRYQYYTPVTVVAWLAPAGSGGQR